MKFTKLIKAEENLNKKYRIEVRYDDDGSRSAFEDACDNLYYAGVKILSNLSRYTLSNHEESYKGNAKELKKEGWDLRPIYAYIHGGIVLSLGRGGQFSDQWDSGLAGFAAVKGKFTPEQEDALKYFIEDYNEIETTTYYGFQIMDENDDVVDSVWGFAFTGDEEQLAKEMKSGIPDKYGISLNNIIYAIKNVR